MSPENVFVSENGNVLEVNEDKAAITGKVTSGRVLIDGLASAMSAISSYATVSSCRRMA